MVMTVEITQDPEHKAQQLIQQRGWSGITSKQVLEMPSMFIGSIDQIMEKLQSVRKKYCFSYFVVSDTDMEISAPIVRQLNGK